MISGVLQWVTQKLFRLSGEAKALFVIVGCLFMAVSWILPWYDMMYFLSPAAFQASKGQYGVVGELIGDSELQKAYGTNIVDRGYSGLNLSHDPVAIHTLGITLFAFRSILYLGGAALLLLWAAQWKTDHVLVRLAKGGIEGFVSLGVVVQVYLCAYHVGNQTSLTKIATVAQASIIKDLGPGYASGILHVEPGLSWGYFALVIGLAFAAIGVMTGEQREAKPGAVAALAMSTGWWFKAVLIIGRIAVLGGVVYVIATVVTSYK